MAQKRQALGRGLDALFGDAVAVDENSSVIEVDIHLIDNNPGQPRKEFNREKLEELAESIRIHGIVQPIVVYANGDRYTIVAGERRFRAAKIVGLETVPVIVRDMESRQILEIALIENIQREDLNPMEEALAIQMLMRNNGMTQEEVAKRLGKSRSAIANSVRLLNLSDDLQKSLREGRIQAGHAKVLLGIQDEKERAELALLVEREGMSVRELEAYIKKSHDAPKPSQPKKEHKEPDKNEVGGEQDKNSCQVEKSRHLDPNLRQVENDMRDFLQTKVTIAGTENKGKLIIEYYNRDVLEALYYLLTQNRND